MKSPKKLLGLATGCLLVGASGAAMADDCPPSLGAVTVSDVIVGPGSRCTLNGTIVQGNVKVEQGGDLRTIGGTHVGGNVQADGAERVLILRGTYVGGDVQIKDTDDGDEDPTTRVVRAMVVGDVQLDDNGGIQVRRTMIGGNLQCYDNDSPIRVSRNMVDGDAEGQCAPIVE